MSGVGYWDRHRTKTLPSRPIHAIGEIGLLLRAEDYALSKRTTLKLERVQRFLDEVVVEIEQVTGRVPEGQSKRFIEKWREMGNRFWS